MICTWPQLRNFDVIAPSTALSISALLKTINGAFPPSSNASLLTPDELCLYSNFPTAVEPKNNKWRICNSYMRALLIRILRKWHSKTVKYFNIIKWWWKIMNVFFMNYDYSHCLLSASPLVPLCYVFNQSGNKNHEATLTTINKMKFLSWHTSSQKIFEFQGKKFPCDITFAK